MAARRDRNAITPDRRDMPAAHALRDVPESRPCCSCAGAVHWSTRWRGGSDQCRRRSRGRACMCAVTLRDGLLACGIVHRDIKLANGCWPTRSARARADRFRLCEHGRTRLAGSADTRRRGASRRRFEQHRPISFSASLADVWSAGVCLYDARDGAAINGPEEEDDAAPREKARGEWDAPLLRSKAAKDLTRRMLAVVPDERITLDHAIAHEWLQAAGSSSSRAAQRS